MISSDAVGTPWYQHFWPWFIVILLGVSVVGSLATVYVAFSYGDEEVERRSVAKSSTVHAPESD